MPSEIEWIAAQIEEACAEAERKGRIDACLETAQGMSKIMDEGIATIAKEVKDKAYEKGWNSAREKAKGIMNECHRIHGNDCGCYARIAAMEP